MLPSTDIKQLRLQKMVEEVEDYAILLLDNEGYIENWNKGAERIKGYKASEIIGKHYRTFYRPEDLATNKPERLLEKARQEGRAQDEGWRVRKDGSHFWGSITITALHNEEGETIGFSKVTRDLTEAKKAENLLLHMQKMEARNDELEQLTYITSHDLQEPLRNISSFIEIFVEDYGVQINEEGKETLQYIQKAVARMSQLINGLLDYGRLGRNAELTEADTFKIAREVCEDLDFQIRQAGAVVQIDPLPVLKVYETEFRLLLQNLIGNAIKFRRPGVKPEVRVWAELQHGTWKFAVKDNGIGIEPKHRDRIFLIFQRLHGRHEFEGSGIGLAHCRRIAEMHQGQIWFESKPGQGSTFYFTVNTNNF